MGVCLFADIGYLDSYKRFNKGHAYFLVVVDGFSQKLAIAALRRQTGKDCAEAFEKCFKQLCIRKNGMLVTDGARNLDAPEARKVFEKYQIRHVISKTLRHAFYAENYVKIFKHFVHVWFTAHNTNSLYLLLRRINRRYIRRLKTSPDRVSLANQGEIYGNLFRHLFKQSKPKPKHAVNDLVYVAKRRLAFTKGFRSGWSQKPVRIRLVKVGFVTPRYYLETLDNPPISIPGAFVESEITSAGDGHANGN